MPKPTTSKSNGGRRRRWKEDLLIILFALSLIYSHLTVSAEMQTGIFPRGGALKTYTDVLHIAQNKGTGGQSSSSQQQQQQLLTKRDGRDRQSLRRTIITSTRRYPQGYEGFERQLQREMEIQPLLCGDVCTMKKERPSSTHMQYRRDGLGRRVNIPASSASMSMSPPFVSVGQYEYEEDDVTSDIESSDEDEAFNESGSGSGNDQDARMNMNTNSGRTADDTSLSYVLRRKSRHNSQRNDQEGENSATDTSSSQETSINSTSSTDAAGGNPLVYRYWNRSRVRRRARGRASAASIPFLILGPRVDHWKLVGKILASRGFNVMACERSKEQQEKGHNGWTNGNGTKTSIAGENDSDNEDIMNFDSEGEALVSSVLDALKWQRAILIGCDKEAVLAMEAALRLAPDRVAGLVFCGDLSSLDDHVRRQIEALQSHTYEDAQGSSGASGDSYVDEDMDIDSFLKDFVDCPCSIIWDGDSSSWSSNKVDKKSSSHQHGKKVDDMDAPSISLSRDMESGRSVIIGGGLAPHRRLPEQFAWSLTRFVENKVSPFPADVSDADFEHDEYSYASEGESEYEYDATMSDIEMQMSDVATIPYQQKGVWGRILPTRVTRAFDGMFAPGSLLVTGRLVASIIIYLSITRVGVFQYHNLSKMQIPPLPQPTLRSIKNVQWKGLLQALPGIAMRCVQMRRRGDSDVDSEPSMGGLFQDEVDEHDKLRADGFSSPKDVNPSEEEDDKDHDEEQQEEPKLDEVPQPENPESDIDRGEDRDHERELDNRLFHKFLFFDQIVS